MITCNEEKMIIKGDYIQIKSELICILKKLSNYMSKEDMEEAVKLAFMSMEETHAYFLNLLSKKKGEENGK